MRKVCLGSPLGDFDVTPTRLWLTMNKDVARPVALILVVITPRLPDADFKWGACVSYQLAACLIEVNFRALLIIRLGV